MPIMSGVERSFCRSGPWRWWTRSIVLPWSLQGIDLQGQVLEIGAGSGAMAEGTLDIHADVHLTLTDSDPSMVAASTSRLADRAGVAVREADATQLPFPDAAFDVCLSHLMLHHVVDWEMALAEVRRVLRSGGQFIGYDLTDTKLARAIHVIDRSPHRLLNPDELQFGLAEAGFSEVRVHTSLAGHAMRFRAQ